MRKSKKGTVWPVVNPDSAEARYDTRLAISSGFPRRPTTVLATA